MKKREIYKRIMGLSLGLCLAFSLNMSANAQTCTAAPSCDSLGYTKSASDCTGEYLKCPFDNNKVFCGGSSSSCGGSGTSGNNGASLAVGDILYSDKTTSHNLVSGKTPIAVVFDVTNQLAVALVEGSKVWRYITNDGYDHSTGSSGDTGGIVAAGE